MLFGAHVEKFWASFCRAVGREDLLQLDVHTVNADTPARAERLWRELRDLFLQRTRAEWTQLFLEHDIAGGPVHSSDELIVDPHFRARATTYKLRTDEGIELELAASAIHVEGEEFAPSPAPALGADTAEVLAAISADTDETRAVLGHQLGT
jgi:crotonobetainyl-CoA:carnitine CoA-transferase CaiB-like acyl-CoA transferase